MVTKRAQAFSLAFDAAGVHEKTPLFEGRLAWPTYQQALESKQAFLLVINAWAYVPIPKRAFTSEQQINSMRDLLKQTFGALDYADR